MSLPDRLLEKLVCPRCKGKLEYEVSLERLVCPACRVSYAIHDGIPVLLIDEAKSLS